MTTALYGKSFSAEPFNGFCYLCAASVRPIHSADLGLIFRAEGVNEEPLSVLVFIEICRRRAVSRLGEIVCVNELANYFSIFVYLKITEICRPKYRNRLSVAKVLKNIEP